MHAQNTNDKYRQDGSAPSLPTQIQLKSCRRNVHTRDNTLCSREAMREQFRLTARSIPRDKEGHTKRKRKLLRKHRRGSRKQDSRGGHGLKSAFSPHSPGLSQFECTAIAATGVVGSQFFTIDLYGPIQQNCFQRQRLELGYLVHMSVIAS